MDTPPQRISFTVAEAEIGMRLDMVLAGRLNDCSRSYAARLIQQGAFQVNRKDSKPSYRVLMDDGIAGCLPAPTLSEFKPEPMDLSVLYEDPCLIVINKPPGLVVHPAPGHPSGTLVNALLHHCPDLAAFGGEIRPGIVHRLDKDTSGALVVAKTPAVHAHLSRQFKNRTVRKIYLAIVRGEMKVGQGDIRLPIGRHPTDRKRMSTLAGRTRTAETHFRVREILKGNTLLELELKTGRTHQIRVHCAALHHPVLGDPVYGGRHYATARPGGAVNGKNVGSVKRQMLHAAQLGFTHPRDGQWRQFEAELPGDMQTILALLRQAPGSGNLL